jgi:hemolysin D
MNLYFRFAAIRDLLGHYKKVFLHFWRLRHNSKADQFSLNEAEFLPAALSIAEKPISPTVRWTAALVMLMMLVAALWSFFGFMDIVVNAQGKIIPSARTQQLASVEVSAVRALYVKEGQQVRRGDVLMELDASSSDAEGGKSAGLVLEAKLASLRAKAMIASIESMRPPHLEQLPNIPIDRWTLAKSHLMGQYLDLQAKLSQLNSQLERLQAMQLIAAQKAVDFETLAKDKDVSQHALLEKRQANIELIGQIAEIKSQKIALVSTARREAYDAWVEADKNAQAGQMDVQRSDVRSQLMRLTAPLDGTVQQLTVHTVGGVVPAAQPLMLIVPKETKMEVEAFIENKDIGFVRLNHKAAVKIDAYEYTKYGTVPARVTSISQDAIQDEKRGLIYAVKVVLDDASIVVDGNRVMLQPGMSVNVEIKTGERRIIEYVLSPLLQHKREALNER